MVTESGLFYLVILSFFIVVLNLLITWISKRDRKAHP